MKIFIFRLLSLSATASSYAPKINLLLLNRKYADQDNPYGDSTEQVNKKKDTGNYLNEGEMVLSRSEAEGHSSGVKADVRSRSKRQAIKDKKRIWTNNRVALFFDNTASAEIRRAFRKVAKAWRDNTCVDLYEDTCDKSPNRIRVTKKESCSSYLGKKGGEQILALGDGCDLIQGAAHELGHALGLFHTHSRQERDYHVKINQENIKEGWLKEFAKETDATVNNYAILFDVGSVMNYGSSAGSINGMRTMTAMDKYYTQTLGSPFISFNDFHLVNMLYSCTGGCTRPLKCKNGGFLHPRNCGRSLCPGGYGGILCDERILEFALENIAVDGCIYGGVEINTQSNQRLTGYRFCSKDDVNTTLQSHSNVVPIITLSRVNGSHIVIQYRQV